MRFSLLSRRRRDDIFNPEAPHLHFAAVRGGYLHPSTGNVVSAMRAQEIIDRYLRQEQNRRGGVKSHWNLAFAADHVERTRDPLVAENQKPLLGALMAMWTIQQGKSRVLASGLHVSTNSTVQMCSHCGIRPATFSVSWPCGREDIFCTTSGCSGDRCKCGGTRKGHLYVEKKPFTQDVEVEDDAADILDQDDVYGALRFVLDKRSVEEKKREIFEWQVESACREWVIVDEDDYSGFYDCESFEVVDGDDEFFYFDEEWVLLNEQDWTPESPPVSPKENQPVLDKTELDTPETIHPHLIPLPVCELERFDLRREDVFYDSDDLREHWKWILKAKKREETRQRQKGLSRSEQRRRRRYRAALEGGYSHSDAEIRLHLALETADLDEEETIEVPTMVGGAGTCWQHLLVDNYGETEMTVTLLAERMREATVFIELDKFAVKYEVQDDGDLHVFESYADMYGRIPEGFVTYAAFLEVLEKTPSYHLVGTGVNEVINAGKVIYGPEVLKGEINKELLQEIKAALRTKYYLSPPERAATSKYLGTEISSSSAKPHNSDHYQILVARDLIRQHLHAIVPAGADGLSTLHIGATFEDFKQYHARVSHAFYLHMSEAKDSVRTFPPLYDWIARKINEMSLPALKSKNQETAKKLKLDPAAAIKLVNEAILKRPTLVTEVVKASRLVFSDSLYNVTEKELCEYFEKTGAVEGFATLFLPSSFYAGPVEANKSEIYTLDEKPNYPDLRGWINTLSPEILLGVLSLNSLPGSQEGWDVYHEKTLLDNLIRKLHTWVVTWAKDHFHSFVDWVVGLSQSSHPFEAFFGVDLLTFKVAYLLKAWVERLRAYLREKFLSTTVTWKHGYSNGYMHNTFEWKKWATQRVFQHGNVRIASEIISRYGEMVIIRFWTCDRSDTIIHTPSPPKHLETMRIWDWNATIKNSPFFRLGQFNPVWTSCLVSDFYEVYSWAMGEPKDSLDFSTVATACNRTRRGLSLVSNVTHKGLTVLDEELSNFALNVYLLAQRDLNDIEEIESVKDIILSKRTVLEEMFTRLSAAILIFATGGLVIPAKMLLAWLLTREDRCEFVQRRPKPTTIVEHVRTSAEKKLPTQSVDLILEAHVPDPANSCLVCSLITDGEVTGQTFVADKCTHEAKEVAFGMDINECASARNLLDQAIDFHRPFIGASALDGARKFESFVSTSMGTGLEHTATFHYILGGPGTGKSFIARALMYKLEKMGYTTLMYLPLAALKADYDKATMADGKMHKFAADTWFSASRTGNIDVLFVDEFTLVDSVHFKAYVNYAKPKHVFLVGDEKQQHKSPDVSVNPGIAESGYWRDIRDNCSVHELQRNFRFKGRGAAFRVKWLNKQYGYRMYTSETDMTPFQTMGQMAYQHLAEKPKEHFVFAHETSQACFGVPSGPGHGQENHSVYASQGRTVESSAVAIFDADRAGMQRHGAAIVALTRSKEMPIIVEHEANSEVLTTFIQHSGITQDLSQEVWPTVKSPVAPLESLIPAKKEINNRILAQALEPVDAKTEKAPTIVFESTEMQRTVMDLAVLEWMLPFFDTCTYEALPFEHRADYLRTLIKPMLEKSPRVTLVDGQFQWTHPGKTVKMRPSKEAFIEWLASRGVAWTQRDVGKKNKSTWTVHTGLGCPYNLVLSFTEHHVERIDRDKTPTMWVAEDLTLPNETIPKRFWDEAPTGRSYGEYYNGSLNYRAPGIGIKPSIVRVANPSVPSEFQTFAAAPKTQYISNQVEVDKTFHSEPRHKGKLRFGKDNFRLAHLIDGSAGVGQLGLSRPSIAGSVLPPPKDFREGFSLNFSETFFGRTKGGRITRKERDAQRSLLPGSGNTFTGGVNETLRGLQRVCGERPTRGLSAEGFEFYQKHMVEAHQACHRAAVLDYLDVDRTVHRFWQDASIRNYLGRTMAERKKHSNVLLKRVTNKKQYKPAKDGHINNTKTAQTITTTSPYWNLMHGAAMRVVNLVFKKTLQDDVFYDSYEPAAQFKDRLGKAVQDLPVGVQYGIVDGSEFDAGQTHGTMVAEMIHRRLSGISAQFIESYYRIRQPGRFVFSGVCSGQTKYEKGSGFSDTLLGNTTLEQMVGHHSIVGKGPRVIGIKGDDFLKVQFDLSPNYEFIKKLQRYSNLSLKIEVSNHGGEFIGCTVGREGVFTSIPRAALKAVGASFRSYQHFLEYQKSIREKIKEIRDGGVSETFAANADAMEISIPTVEACYAILESIGHVDEKAYLRYFQRRKDQLPPPPNVDRSVDMHTFNSFCR